MGYNLSESPEWNKALSRALCRENNPPNSTHFPLTHVILAGCVRAQIEIQIAWRVALSLRVKNDSDDDEDPLLN